LKGEKGVANEEDIRFRKSPLAPLCQRGVIPPFVKGGKEDLDINPLYIMMN
jgi:hypothetical protein